jgi:glycosyltransferase involved in cell wall biosynthesis
MQILIIATSYYPHIGGVEYIVKSTAERLVRKGHNITAIAGNPAGKHISGRSSDGPPGRPTAPTTSHA